MLATLMKKATINVGGQLLNAVRIEHFILRHPYRLKLSCSKSPERNETEIRVKFGLEWSEVLNHWSHLHYAVVTGLLLWYFLIFFT
ncbi:hypothetical protein CTI12_AA453310 [Artemisia annua]|uniref:DUF547 domain-containing protein n=1 Tax=Artemisia annua TaxID=35608 RepID=A0A2U1LUE1_ARTAN|nr:hypothetical protein CTI12_AA453310 [Artemisia annua]